MTAQHARSWGPSGLRPIMIAAIAAIGVGPGPIATCREKGVAIWTDGSVIEHMFAQAMGEVRERLADLVGQAEPGIHDLDEAVGLVKLFTEIKRLAAAGELLFAKRVADAGSWDGRDRSAAHWFARETGISVGDAQAKFATAERLEELPATAEAFRAGKLSDQQARHVSIGATADPDAETMLLETAANDSLRELENQARRAQAVDDEETRQKRIHANRGLWSGVDSDGTFRLTYRGTAASGSRILTALKPFTDQAFKTARRAGRTERLCAYAADGFVAMADVARQAGQAAATQRVPRNNVKVIVAVDLTALRRGNVDHGETCEIRGVGPIPVSTALELLGEAALAIVINDGVDVRNVTHPKRRTTAHQRTVLEWWGLKCDVKGCDSTDFVDVHHIYEWARTHHTRIDELTVRCNHHHRQHHKGWRPPPDQLRRPPPEQLAWSA
jgi:hypothetical protein